MCIHDQTCTTMRPSKLVSTLVLILADASVSIDIFNFWKCHYREGEGYHGISASQSSCLGSRPSHLIFTFCDLHIFKLSIFTSYVFTTVIFQILHSFHNPGTFTTLHSYLNSPITVTVSYCLAWFYNHNII